jgi:AAA domain
MVKRKDGRLAPIAGFWRAVEIFSPQQIPAPDAQSGVVDFGPHELMPWEAGSRRYREPPEGKTWRHQVFGGVYELIRVRDVLARLYPDDTEGESAPAPGQSALFACTVDESGVLVEGSAALSSCAWAVGRAIKNPGKLPLDGFDADASRYGESLGQLVGAPAGSSIRLLAATMRGVLPDAPATAPGDGSRPDTGPEGDGGEHGDEDETDGHATPEPSDPERLELNPLRGPDLRQFTADLAGRLGVQDELMPWRLRVRSYLVSIRKAVAVAVAVTDEDEQSFLNSFYSDDLQRVADALTWGDAGQALTAYLTGGDRAAARERVDVRSDPSVVWQGCRPDRIPLGRWAADLSRPLELSQQFAVNEVMRCLADTTGIFAVNGPPGTGKTTMLRDLVAAIVVIRAQQLAALPTTAAAFDRSRSYSWQTESRQHQITPVNSKLTGMEIVVASTNNGAVANVTTEIPGPDGIGARWAAAADDVDYFGSTARLVHGAGAWGMIAARLGNRKFRDTFAELFWWGNPDPRKRASWPRLEGAMVDVLTWLRAEPTDWQAARAAFRTALEKVQTLSTERQVVASAIERIRVLEAAITSERAAIATADAKLVAPKRRKLTVVAGREKAADRLNALAAELATEQERVSLAKREWGDHVPFGPEFFTASRAVPEDDAAGSAAGPEECRERISPWADDAFATARTELFLAALALHKAFIAAESVRIGQNLGALIDILKGRGRPDGFATLAAWQTFFLVVPVVSTTFASLPSMFAGLGRESLGWLFIDEAGQAAPQHAVGGIWRARRVVVVGDPLQLEPVVTLPWGGQRALLAAFKLDPEWAPTRTSVQRLADRQTARGTYLPGYAEGGDAVWVGSPLRVHRRCDHPMLDISNEIAYGGLMVDGVPGDRHPFPGRNYWYDVQSGVAEGNWIGAEGERLGWLLTQLRERGVPAAGIRVISPFRQVANRAIDIHRKVFTEVSKEDREKWVGTVHTMQGKEADVVILVLGGNPARPRARAFATGKPNLLNVAVTRARRRLYVIGNHAIWGNAPYFHVLARHTEVWPPAERGKTPPGETVIG